MDEQTIKELEESGKISPETAALARQKIVANQGGTSLLGGLGEALGGAARSGLDAYARPYEAIGRSVAPEQGNAYSIGGLNDFTSRFSSGFEKSGPAPASISAPSIEQEKKEPERVDLSRLAIPSTKEEPTKAQGFDLSEINRAYGLQQKGITESAAVQARGLEQQAQIYEDLAKKQAEVESQIAALRNERSQKANERLMEIEKLSERVNKESEINPNRYWQNMSTGNKIAAALSIALGSIGAAMMGSPNNKAWEIINGAIDRDIEAQKNSVSNARNKLEAAKSLYGMMLQKYGDQESALLATKAVHLGQAENMAKAYLARAQGDQAKANANILLGQLKEEQAKLGLALNANAVKQVAARQASFGPGVEDPSVLPEEYQKRVVQMPNGLFKPAISEEGAKEVNKVRAQTEKLRAIVNELYRNAGSALPFTEKTSKAKVLEDAMRLQLLEMGVNEKSIKELDKLIPDVSAFKQGDVKQALSYWDKYADNALQSAYKAYVPGYKPIEIKRK
jgi:hypothetical protein